MRGMQAKSRRKLWLLTVCDAISKLGPVSCLKFWALARIHRPCLLLPSQLWLTTETHPEPPFLNIDFTLFVHF